MAFVSINNFRDEGERRHGGGRAPLNQCTMRVNINSTKGTHREALQISIPEHVMRNLRWLIGDRVEVMFDDRDQTLVMLRRVQRDGYALSSSQGKDGIGKVHRANVKFARPERLPFKLGDRFYEKSATVTNDGLVVQFEKA